MKITRVEVRYGRSVQFEQYENTRFDAMLSADLDEIDDPERIANELRATCKNLVKLWIKLEERSNMQISGNDNIPF